MQYFYELHIKQHLCTESKRDHTSLYVAIISNFNEFLLAHRVAFFHISEYILEEVWQC